MVSLLLALIYVSFVSLGLPDSLLGSAWPVMRVELGAPLSMAGAISMIITAGTVLSSLMSDRLTRKLGAGLVTAVSVGLTAVSLFGFSLSSSLWMLCLWAIPYGLGAGAIDAALNNYVALHYSARHMSWLHCCWGVGASISPYIMSYCLSSQLGWQMGYRSVSLIQIALTAILFLGLPLWKKKTAAAEADGEISAPPVGLLGALRIKGVPLILIAFLSYCAMETTAGLWATSYLAEYRGVDPEVAAQFASLFYLGITFGRFLCGFIANRLGDRFLIRMGILVVAVGVVGIMLPTSSYLPALVGLLVTGFGCAPIYPSIIHSTPDNFGKENSQAIVGIQMASAYTGSALMPPLFGLLAGSLGLAIYPFYLAVFVVLMLVMTERLRKVRV